MSTVSVPCNNNENGNEDMDDTTSFAPGLGYDRNSHSSTVINQSTFTNNSNLTPTLETTDTIIRNDHPISNDDVHQLKQEYQEQQDDQNITTITTKSSSNNNITSSLISPELNQVPQFVPSSIASMDTATTITLAGTGQTQLSRSNDVASLDTNSEIRIREGRIRAQEIIARFQQNQPSSLLTVNSNNISSDTGMCYQQQTDQQIHNNKNNIQTTIHETNNNTCYLEQRQIGLNKEQQKKQNAFTKNLHYIMIQQQYRMEQLSNIMTSISSSTVMTSDTSLNQKNYTNNITDQQQNSMVNDHNDANLKNKSDNTTIDTSITDNRPSKKYHNETSKKTHITTKQSHSNDTVALYIYTEPMTDTINEAMLREIFHTYGTIRNIFLYRHHDTNNTIKGDAIIVYKLMNQQQKYTNRQIDNVENTNTGTNKMLQTKTPQQKQRELIDLVCSQMNGAELPNGSILRVEPAKSKDFGGGSIQPKHENHNDSTEQQVDEPSNVKKHEPLSTALSSDNISGDTDDLDDFFDSL